MVALAARRATATGRAGVSLARSRPASSARREVQNIQRLVGLSGLRQYVRRAGVDERVDGEEVEWAPTINARATGPS